MTHYDTQQPGQNVVNSVTSDDSFGDVVGRAIAAAEDIVGQQLPYLPQGPSNSNGAANTIFGAATGQSGLPSSRPSTTPQFNPPSHPIMPGIKEDLSSGR